MSSASGFQGGGIMGQCVHAHDWAKTPLGPAETWPQSLRTALSIMLSSAFPTYLAWGPELTSFYNDAYIPIMGDKPNCLGRPFPEVWSEVWDTIGPITRRALDGEASYFEDLPLTLTRRGYPEETWFSFSYSPIRDETGGIGGILCTVLETTQRVHAEAALRRSEARLRATTDLVGVSPYTWDPVTGALGWDARLKAMWGLSPHAPVDEAIFLSGVHPDDRPRVEAAIAQCTDPSGSGIYAIEYRVIGIQDGVERWVSTYGRTTFEDGRPIAFIGAASDITERKRAEAALRESEERFRQFANNSSNTLWVLNFETMNLEFLSLAFETMWGELRERVLSDPSRWNGFLHPDDRQRALTAIERVKLGEVCSEEFRIVRKDRGVRWIRNTFFPIRDAQGQIRRVGGIAEDITRNEGRFVYVVDAEVATSQALSQLLAKAGYRVRVFSSGKGFLEAAPALASGCVVLDVCRTGAGGLAVSSELKARRLRLPTIVLGNAKADMAFAVQAMKAGAVDFLPFQYGSEQFLSAIASAIASTDEDKNEGSHEARLRISEMSEREREVLAGLMAGKTNKGIGRDIGLSPRTVETHRAHVMQKLGVQTLSQAVLVATAAGFQPSPGARSGSGPLDG